MSAAALQVDEFVEAIRPELEHQVDAWILQQADAGDRLMLMRRRRQIVDKLVDATKIANLEHRLAEIEDRQKLRVVG